ncbi:MAG: small GTP-binding protein [Candidatus Woesearchaeota archaeon]|jgi:small GTP-binding protein
MAKADEKVEKKVTARDTANTAISELEKQISTTKYNKKTQGAIGIMKAKLAMLRQKQEARSSGGKAGEGYSVRKTGDGTVVLLGFPSAGKSTLLNALTNANSPVGAYAFTTLTCIPGLLDYKHAKIQILDVPGIIAGAASGQGRGKEVLQVIRSADFVLVLLDVFHPEHHAKLLKEVHDTGIRINKMRPDVKITKTSKNGVRVGSTVPLKRIDVATIKNICNTFRINNADILIRSDIDADDFIDIIENNKVYLPSITVINKVDIADEKTRKAARDLVKPDLEMSAHRKPDIAKLKDILFDRMKLIRLYLKEVNKPADMKEPLIMWEGCTIKNVCEKLHKDFFIRFRYARIWGQSAKFDGQKILKTKHVLKDEDVLELHIS